MSRWVIDSHSIIEHIAVCGDNKLFIFQSSVVFFYSTYVITRFRIHLLGWDRWWSKFAPGSPYKPVQYLLIWNVNRWNKWIDETLPSGGTHNSPIPQLFSVLGWEGKLNGDHTPKNSVLSSHPEHTIVLNKTVQPPFQHYRIKLIWGCSWNILHHELNIHWAFRR